MNQSTERCVIMTGATGGIGGAIAARLAQSDYSLVLGYAPSIEGDKERAQKQEADFVSGGNKCMISPFELSDAESMAGLVAEAMERFGNVYGVVHCAARFSLDAPTERSLVLAERYFTENAVSTFALFEEAAKVLSDGGRMIAFSSTGARKPAPGSVLYSGTKAACEGMVRALALELGPRRITVNTVSPGPTDTAMLAPEFREAGAALSPFARLGLPSDHAGLVNFLLSEDGAWLTGQTFLSNGGYVMS